MNKGIVMKKTAKTLVIMTPNGEYREIAKGKRTSQIGEQITFKNSEALDRDKLTLISIGTSLVVAILISVIIFGGFNKMPNWFADHKVVAFVTLDINPSIEFGIDKLEKVRQIEGLNDEGTELIQGLEYKDKTLDEVMGELLVLAETPYLSAENVDIVFTATTIKESRLLDTHLANDLKKEVETYLETNHSTNIDNFKVVALAVSPEFRVAAEKEKLSSGKYAAYLVAKNNGFEVSKDQFLVDSVTAIAEGFPGFTAVLLAQTLTKDDLTLLLKQEKSGELDRKLTELNGQNAEEGTEASDSANSTDEESNTPTLVEPTTEPTATHTPNRTPARTPNDEAVTPTPTPSVRVDTGTGSDSGNGQTDGTNNEGSGTDDPGNPSETGNPGNETNNGNNETDGNQGTNQPTTSATPTPTPVVSQQPTATEDSEEDCGWLGC
ncbi:MAG: anti-sigma factor domain-containing protein [Gorillibacterium sp.]|nr:anti-sigma factor domain-containing protein [Gorillibacterium sp.]